MAMPTTVFRNGHVFDGSRHRRDTGLVVAGDRVVAVVPERELEGYVGHGTAVVDLGGGLVSPGFQDAHAHPVQGGLERLRCDLSALGTKEEYLAAVRDYARTLPRDAWVTGGGWSMSVFGPGGPTAAELDAVVEGRPAYLLNRDHHGAWVSSTALRRAGVDAATPDPVDGRLERDADGEPTGTLHEGAMDLVERHVPAPTDEDYDRALQVAQAHLHSVGITAWQDAILGEYAGLHDPAPTYLRAQERGELTARVRGALWWDREQGTEQLAGLLERRTAFTEGRLCAGSVKIMQDGIAENYTAAMTAPYLDACGCRTSNSGLSFLDPGALREAVVALDAHGFQVHVHAIGDRAVREALDALAAARRANGGNDLRHHLAHLQVVHPDDRGRFAELDVVVNMQPLWAHLDDQMRELTLPYLGPERSGWQYPFADLAASGARLAAGSDWPVSAPDPLLGMHVAVNRWAYGEEGPAGSEPFLPEQRLSLEQAFAASTSGSAYVNHLDDTGTLREGALADLVVLDRDPFAGDVAEIGATQVVATYVDGRPVFTT